MHKKSFFNLSLILVIFIGPMVAAWVAYHTSAYKHHATVNAGQLLQPPLDFNQLSITTKEGGVFDRTAWHDHWLMWYWIPTTCDNSCQTTLYKMRQVRVALGKNMDRVQRAVVTPPQSADPILDKLLIKEYEGTTHVFVLPAQMKDFFAHSSLPPLALKQGSLYLVDPLGNVMMVYQPDIAPKKLLKDLNRLLEVSQIG